MLKRQRGTVTAFQVARPVLLRFAFTFFHQELLGTGSRARLRSGLGLAQTHSTTEEVRDPPQHLSARESAHLLPQNNASQEGPEGGKKKRRRKKVGVHTVRFWHIFQP